MSPKVADDYDNESRGKLGNGVPNQFLSAKISRNPQINRQGQLSPRQATQSPWTTWSINTSSNSLTPEHHLLPVNMEHSERNAQLSDDDNFEIDSVIGAQLYGISRISRIPQKSPNNNDSESNSETPASADNSSYRSFSASELVDLLQELEIPYLKSDDLMIQTRSNIVGRGGFAEVKYESAVTSFYDAQFSQQGAAIKELSLIYTVQNTTSERLSQTASLSTITQAYIEICIMKHPCLSSHPNILQLFGTTDYHNKFVQSSAWSELCLVTEYADLGSLESYLSTHSGKLEWGFKCRLINDIAEGLQAIHSCDIVHNDIKCGNVLLFAPTHACERIVAKISDFGCSVPLARTNQIRGVVGGTRLFSAPEAYSWECLVEPSRDIYSFALLMLQAVMEERPFETIPEDALWEFKSGGEFSGYVQDCFRRAAPTRVGGVMNRLILEGLNFNPENRLSDLSQVSQLLPQSDRRHPDQTISTLDPTWLLGKLSSREPESIHQLLDKFRKVHSRKAAGQPSIQERAFHEALNRAIRQTCPQTALDLALYYGYGIGTKFDWEECVAWLRIAAAGKNDIAVTFLQSLGFTVDNVEVTERLLSQCRLLLTAKEANLGLTYILEIFQRIAPSSYEDHHSEMFRCPCRPVHQDSSDERDTILQQLWDHYRRCGDNRLPSSISEKVSQNARIVNSEGKTLLQELAVCRHPPFPEDTTDIIRCIGELLLDEGCSIKAAAQEGEDVYSLALESRNLSLLSLLSERHLVGNISNMQITDAAIRHDHELLNLIFSANDPPLLPHEKQDLFKTALQYASLVPLAERKLRHGNTYLDRGKNSMDILYQYNYKHRILVGYPFRDLVLGGLVSAGSADLIPHFFTNRLWPLPADALRPQILNREVIKSIRWGWRDLFGLFIRLGADTNLTNPLQASKTAWQAAAIAVRRDGFYINELIRRGADWGKLGTDTARSVITLLAMDSNGAPHLKNLLRKYPELLISTLVKDRKGEESEHSVQILIMAVRVGFPSTVSAILEACSMNPNLSNYHLPALIATTGPRPECLQNLDLLLSYGATSPTDRKRPYLSEALIYACQEGNIQAMQKLLHSGADPNYVNFDNGTVNISPYVAALVRRRMLGGEKVKGSMSAQVRFEERKFWVARKILLDGGLDLSLQLGVKNETAEEYVQGIKNLV